MSRSSRNKKGSASGRIGRDGQIKREKVEWEQLPSEGPPESVAAQGNAAGRSMGQESDGNTAESLAENDEGASLALETDQVAQSQAQWSLLSSGISTRVTAWVESIAHQLRSRMGRNLHTHTGRQRRHSTGHEHVTGKVTLSNGTATDNLSMLEALTSERIRQTVEITQRRDIGETLRKIAFVACFCVFCYAVVQLISHFYGYYKADQLYSGIQDLFYGEGTVDSADSAFPKLTPSSPGQPTVNLYTALGAASESSVSAGTGRTDDFQLILPRLDALKEVNRDTYGWIKIEGTRIDYPLVQGNDNEYYLSHAFDKSYLVSGSCFVDYNNSKTITKNKNTVIYAHNMTDGSMFHTLLNFKDANLFQNGRIEIYTTDGIYSYTPFSAYVAEPDYFFFRTEFADDTEFADFVTEVKGNSMYRSNVRPKGSDTILTLMTCTNTAVNKRFVVHALLTEISN